MTATISTSSYYDLQPIMSRNAAWNFVVGGRGIGKSYGMKVFEVRDYLRRGRQFIWLRRYKDELKASAPTFFADIAHLWPDYAFRLYGNQFQVCRRPDDKKPVWETMGYAIALSVAQSVKSVAFPKVHTIHFEEFILDVGVTQYLANEARVAADFFNTVDRYQDRVRMFFLANAVSIMNPYFGQYKIVPRDGITSYAGGFIAAEFPTADAYAQEASRTRFGRFIQGTDYAEYAIGNAFHDNGDNLLADKPAAARYFCTIETGLGTFSVWRDTSGDVDDRWYCQQKLPKEPSRWYTLVPETLDESKTMLVFTDRIGQILRTAWRNGRMFFDSPQTRNMVADIFTRT